jgi:hypothetical protein
MRTTVLVIQGRLAESEPHRTSAIEAAYHHFRLDKQGSSESPHVAGQLFSPRGP